MTYTCHHVLWNPSLRPLQEAETEVRQAKAVLLSLQQVRRLQVLLEPKLRAMLQNDARLHILKSPAVRNL
jgi:hypothetical protein